MKLIETTVYSIVFKKKGDVVITVKWQENWASHKENFATQPVILHSINMNMSKGIISVYCIFKGRQWQK